MKKKKIVITISILILLSSIFFYYPLSFKTIMETDQIHSPVLITNIKQQNAFSISSVTSYEVLPNTKEYLRLKYIFAQYTYHPNFKTLTGEKSINPNNQKNNGYPY